MHQILNEWLFWNFIGEAVIGGGEQPKKKDVANGRNRKALGEVGNVANVRGVEGKPNRPITRRVGANAPVSAAAKNKKQACKNVTGPPPVAKGVALAKKAATKQGQRKVTVKPKPEEVNGMEASADKEFQKDKKQACANMAGRPPTVSDRIAVAKRVAAKPGQKKVTVKPKPEEVIIIEANQMNKKKENDGNFKKKPHPFTSVLTARSKAACGITNKLREQIIDIDAGDIGNELAAVEYIDDIYKFCKLVENENRPHDYIDSQPEVNERMRAILVDWLIEVNTKFDLSPETLYLTINIIDRFLAVKNVPRREMQLVGISAMLIASKYEEVSSLVFLSDGAYTHEQILVMEKIILGKLEWNLTVPTPLVFLVRFIKASVPDQELENMAHFLSELGMMNYATLRYCPSMVAASAVYAARCTLNKASFWSETLKLHTGYSQEQLMDCGRSLVSFHSMYGKGKLKFVHGKYSDPHKGAVAMLPPAKNLLPPYRVNEEKGGAGIEYKTDI
ncbi:unnamed protein product [Sphenostylis stenocarpa]|uniref:B-like cyclin n=1 Tax=Sphenostylis stenocarpa TaxID=92480 RepID=A0AA86RSH7_9FABA|nr:unnamed protein product [Sphenostylis stenocarpa]